jgi:hypothetical protein
MAHGTTAKAQVREPDSIPDLVRDSLGGGQTRFPQFGL